MKVGELFVFLGIKVDDKQLKGFDKGLKGVTGQLDLTKLAAVGAIYAIDRFIESSVAGGVALYNFTQQTGDSAQALQQWQVAAASANPALGVDQIAQSIQTLENNLVEIRKFGQGNASPFAWLQIDIAHGENAIDVLEQLRDRVQGLDRVTAVNLIQKMGLNPGFINILTRSKEEFDALVKSMSRSDGTINTLQKMGERIANLKLNLILFKDNLIADFAPAINKLLDVLQNFGQAISRAFAMIKEFSEESPNLFRNIATGVGVLLAALNPLKTTIVGLLLLLEDLYVYKKGGNSLIGELFGEKGQNFTTGKIAGQGGTLFDIMDSFDKFQKGEYKKNYREQIPGTYEDYQRTQNQNNVDRSVTINNDISISHPDGESIAEKIVNQNKKAIDQVDLNYSLTDQQYNGSGY